MRSSRTLFVLSSVLALAAALRAEGRRMDLGLGVGLGAFNGCPSFEIAAAFPLSSRISAEAEFAYFFNPADEERNPSPGYHRSSAGLGLAVSGALSLTGPGARLIPYLSAGAGAVYLSVLTDRPPAAREISGRLRPAAFLSAGVRLVLGRAFGLKAEARGLWLSGGEGGVARLLAGAFLSY